MKFSNRKSPRAQWHDYRSACGYFVTICCKDREHYFGEIEKGHMILNELGKYCDRFILSLSEKRKTIEIHSHVVMPNHVHMAIIMSDFSSKMNIPTTNHRRDDPLGHPNDGKDENTKKDGHANTIRGGHAKSMSLQVFNEHYTGPTLGSVINMFKGAITKYAKKHNMIFRRQSRYHDNIIRNQSMYENIEQYILHNPKNRKEDRFWN